MQILPLRYQLTMVTIVRSMGTIVRSMGTIVRSMVPTLLPSCSWSVWPYLTSSNYLPLFLNYCCSRQFGTNYHIIVTPLNKCRSSITFRWLNPNNNNWTVEVIKISICSVFFCKFQVHLVLRGTPNRLTTCQQALMATPVRVYWTLWTLSVIYSTF